MVGGTKITLGPDDLQALLDEQIQFLKASADSYDRGFRSESKRLALTLRVLLHQTKSATPILLQAGRFPAQFLSTAFPPYSPQSVSTYSGLTMMALDGTSSRHVARLDDELPREWLPFDEWWAQVVIVDDAKTSLSRRQLVLTAADQDGGAHVDPAIDEAYYRLTRKNSLAWVYSTGPLVQPITGAAAATIRQITHEVIRTLDPNYRKKTTEKAQLFASTAQLFNTATPPQPPLRRPLPGRNDPCPCGSGRKFKHCHGR